MAVKRYGVQHCACEWAYSSGQVYADPFNEIELDVLFTGPQGQEWAVPAYWAGDQEWRVRFAPPTAGMYTYRTVCTDPHNPDLHGQQGILVVKPYAGSNKLLQHGPLRVSEMHTHLEHLDGTPFLWLADMWWFGMCKRLTWPEEFQRLTADRAAKGFSAIQIVAGFSCDTPPYDERGENEAGHPWEADYARINPAYFDMADLRLQWLVHEELLPCLLGCWGFYLPWMGVQKVKQHWRYLIARYGAYPVIWCLAGCGTMPYYLSQHKEEDRLVQKRGWTEVARYVREVDPYHHPVTMHPTDSARDQVEDDALIDVDMLQAGHMGLLGVPRTLDRIRAAIARSPRKPVVSGENAFEGRFDSSHQEVQRLMFWTYMLSGAVGFTYCAEGLWQVNKVEQPFGPSPGGVASSDITWWEAAQQPGSRQLGIGRRLLERYGFGRLESHPEWIEPHASGEDFTKPHAAGIPGQLRIFYFPRPASNWGPPVMLKGLEAEAQYRATYLDPRNGQEHPLGTVSGPEWRVPFAPRLHDWVLVLERV